jgi:hypothetical protein
MKIEVPMTENIPTQEGIYYILRADDKLKKAAAAHIYRNSMGFMQVRPVAHSGISRSIDSLKGKVLFSVEPVEFKFVRTSDNKEVSTDYPL